MAYGMPMHMPFPYFYPPNGGSKTQHFPVTNTVSQISGNDGKTSARRSNTSPENSSSPINFSSRIQSTFNNNLSKSMEDFPLENYRRSRSMSNEEKSRDQPDDENVEVD